MKIILVMAMSLDGKTTRWDETRVYQWTSAEDKAHFNSVSKKCDVLLMGRKTFLAAKSVLLQLPEKVNIIVLTSRPKKKDTTFGIKRCQFVRPIRNSLMTTLTKLHPQKVLLVGGAETNQYFFGEQLVDEVWVTIEPIVFGKGKGITLNEKVAIELQLRSIKKLNHKGTLLVKYAVKHPQSYYS